MPVCPDASGTNWLIVKQKLSVGTQRGNQALSPRKQHCVRRVEGSGPAAVTVAGSARESGIFLSASWCCAWPGMTHLVLRSVSLSL